MKFNRTINLEFELIENNKILSHGHFADDYHDLRCFLIFSLPTLEVIETGIDMNRLPQEICKVPLKRIDKLKGLKIERGFRQKVKRIVGGEGGCIHLVDLIHEMAQGVVALLRKAQITPGGKEMKDFPTDIFYGECIGLKKQMSIK